MAKMLDVLVETRQKRDRVVLDPKPGQNILYKYVSPWSEA